MRKQTGAGPFPARVMASLACVVALWAGSRHTPAGAQPAAPQAEKPAYASAREAYQVGQAFLASKNLPRAQEALEQALKLDPDAALKGKIYRALVGPYRALPEIGLFLDAMEFVIRNPENPAEPLTARRTILSHVQSRGKAAHVAERYEAALKKDPDDRTALLILSGIYVELLKQPQRGAELTDRLLAVTRKESGGALEPDAAALFAEQYVKSGRLKEGAELYEKAAALDPKMSAWYLKEAAVAWLKNDAKDQALKTARAATAAPPEARSRLLTHFWHRQLGEVFLRTGAYPLAIEHLMKAIENTDIEGYKEDCQKLLDEARRKDEG
jgi:tetratricopeptide (TPR) repeat protein